MALRTVTLTLLTILPSVLANPTPLLDTRQACRAFICRVDEVCQVISGRPVCVPKPIGFACGKNVCARGEVCCNESCGICTKPGDKCPQVICPPSALSSEKRESSGMEGIERSPDVEKRGASLGNRCGKNVCALGQVCCNESCGICTKPGDKCPQVICPSEAGTLNSEKRQSSGTEEIESSPNMEKREASGTDETQDIGRQCGSKMCLPNQRCCNPTCGYCVYPFEVCLPRVCAKEE